MLPEAPGSSYFTLLVADRLADLTARLGRPVTVDELVDDMYDAPGIPWGGLNQNYQRRLALQARADARAKGADPSILATLTARIEDPNGVEWEAFDKDCPKARRTALRSAVMKIVNNHSGNPTKRAWLIRDSDGRISRHPTIHPRVVNHHRIHDWSPETQAVAQERHDEAIAVVNRSALVRQLRNLSLEGTAAALRRVARHLPASKSSSSKCRGLLADLDAHLAGDPRRVLALLSDWLAEPNAVSEQVEEAS